MYHPNQVIEIEKESTISKLNGNGKSSLKKYQEFFIGQSNFVGLLKYEAFTTLIGALPGAVGLFFRKLLYPFLFKKVGSGVVWGRNIVLRHSKNMIFGDQVAIDDNCLLDATGSANVEFRIGNDTVIARDTIIQGKTSWIQIGNSCTIGSQCQVSSAGGIRIGNYVMVAGQCYLGGGRYHMENPDVPIRSQGLYSNGPLIIEDDVWLGAGARVLDGVTIGRGSFIGAGAVISENIAPYSII